MKLLAIFILGFILQSNAIDTQAQNKRLSLQFENKSLKEVLLKLEDQTEFSFIYKDEMINSINKVSGNFKDEKVTDLLNKVLQNTGLTYMIEGRAIVILSNNSETIIEQQKTVSGKVTDSTGASLPGVSVVVKGTTAGTITDANGNYSLSNVPENATLQFSFVGMKQQEIVVAGKTTIDVTLVEDAIGVEEVVVTALGIEKSSKSLTYATEKVAGSELTKIPQTNLMNSMNGKVSGMTISRSGAGLGGSVKVLLRGNKSAQGNNQPLYVVDGIPLVNFNRETISSTYTFLNRDGGDGISNLNPDDIESISVLKGASAASLYGSQAANGVILITTKKGKAGVSKVDFSSSLTVDKIAYKPELQNSYGETSPGSEESWGAPITNATDNISDFFQNGTTAVNSVGLSSGNENLQTYLSYANTSSKGIVEGNTLSKHNLGVRQSARLFDNKLKLDADVKVVSQTINNNPVYGFQSGPLHGLYTFPRGKDFAPYKKDYQILDPVRLLNTQNWPFVTADNQNPYWVINKNLSEIQRNRTIANLSVRYDITSSLNIQLRGNMDRINDLSTTKYFVGSPGVFAGLNGGYSISDITTTQYYSDALLNFTHTFGDVQLISVLGTSITDSRASGETSESNTLNFPNIFTIQNMNRAVASHLSVSEGHQQLQAVFGNINLSYKDWLYFDVTGRNDWSSNLSFTPNGSYFYPSAGLGVLLHQLAPLPEYISYAKLRSSYAVVGNTVPIYVTNPVNYYSIDGTVVFNNTAPFNDLKPEKSRSLELGAEIRLFQNQFSMDFTYYKANSINQFFSIEVPPGTGFSRRFINGGDIQNSGIEIMAGYTSLPDKILKWSSILNYSANKNVVKKLATNIDEFVLANDINNYSSILKVDGSYGDIYAQVLKRDEATGKIIINSEGFPVVETGPRSFVGNPNPKFKLGWNNSFNYKNLSLSFLVDGSFGGKVMSLTEQVLDGTGVSKASGDARNNGGVVVDAISETTGAPVTLVDAQKWYKTIGGRQHVTGEYMYDATNVRIREVSLGFSLPAKILNNGIVKNIKLSVIGRNLVYLYKKAPFDPEIAYSTGNGISGVDILSLPATRSIGLNLNVSF